MHLRSSREPLDPAALARAIADDRAGAVATFVGTVRSPNRGRRVLWIDYHGYEAMIDRELERIAVEVITTHRLLGLALAHRLGRLRPGEASIVLVAGSEHRDAAFEACRDALERCKARLPIWKQEAAEEGTHWIAGRSVPGSILE